MTVERSSCPACDQTRAVMERDAWREEADHLLAGRLRSIAPDDLTLGAYDAFVAALERTR